MKSKRKTDLKEKMRTNSEEDDYEDDYDLVPLKLMVEPPEPIVETPVMADNMIEPDTNKPTTEPPQMEKSDNDLSEIQNVMLVVALDHVL